MAENYEELLNHREVAKLMGVAPDTVHRHVEQGLIPREAYIRLPGGARSTGNGMARGNSLLFKRAHIEKLVADNTSRATNFETGGSEK